MVSCTDTCTVTQAATFGWALEEELPALLKVSCPDTKEAATRDAAKVLVECRDAVHLMTISAALTMSATVY